LRYTASLSSVLWPYVSLQKRLVHRHIVQPNVTSSQARKAPATLLSPIPRRCQAAFISNVLCVY
jgi:hypothetical protein